ncbi:MAG: ABC transporter ATP-binding protein [Oscillospiraceae bacterium]|nr:ABC transporter ATP-binding protein [Oscillospiraceae bacterium]
MEKNRILDITDLRVSFDTYAGEVQAVRGISLYVDEGEALAIVGESGCGKSVTAKSIMRLNPEPPARIAGGSISLCGNEIVEADDKKMQTIRGKDVSMVFQDPMTCLNPTMQIGKQLIEAIQLHQRLTKEEANAKAIELLQLVNIPNAAQRAKQYPHEFSGGMRQRVMIAMALSCNPKLLIADEPTTALDVTIQAQIIELLEDIRVKTNTAIILITHDLGVVAGLANRVCVMYAGKIVESGSAEDIFYRHKHPYTLALLNSLPKPDTEHDEKLISIPGTPPDLIRPPVGCPFASRCEHAMSVCQTEMPEYFDVGEGHKAACWLLHPDCPKNVKGDKKA